MVSQKWTSAYDYAASSGYFFKTKEGLPYNYSYLATSDFQVSQVDFTNPKAVDWYQQQLDVVIEAGFKGWMYDFGEYTPHDSVSYDGHDGLYMHNLFPLQYQKACFDHLVDVFGTPHSDYAPDFVFYVRSGYLGSQRVTWAHWTGDPSADWNKASGLPAQLVAMLNIGISGMPYSGSDIGGFAWYVDPPPTMELWARWTQLGCFSGLMHEQGSGTGRGPKTHIFDTAEGTRIWRKYAKLRTQLSLYIYYAAHQARESGTPIMRHHILTYPRDPKAMEQEYQYMFGEGILVAPVIEKGVTKLSVYLPVIEDLSNNWVEFFASSKYIEKDGSFRIGFKEYLKGGTTVEVDAPVDNIPIFVRAGYIIITTDPRVQTLSPAKNSSVKTFQSMSHIRHVWAWPMRENDFIASGRLHDDSMYMLYYGKIDNCICEFIAFNTPKNITHVVQIAGPWIVKPNGVQTEGGEIKLPKASSVQDLLSKVDNSTVSEWFFDDEMNTMWIKLTPPLFDVFVMGSMDRDIGMN
uniref:sulfoquinovosidase-like n=1 Tax=Styela clava TaxID=7725 RepID=UPI001939E8DB|nr:sulfoquinovosidase-like [Styela clava]